MDTLTDDAVEFKSWMERVETECIKNFGLTIDDLPDQPYYDWFEDDLDPSDVVEEIAEREGLDELY